MKKMNKVLASALALLLMTAVLCGCKAGNTQKTETSIKVGETGTHVTEESEILVSGETETEEAATFLVNEGDVEIVVPDDQEMGGE